MKKILCSLLWIAAATTGIHAQETFATKTADSLFSSLYEKGSFNGNVLLAKKGKVIYKKSYGLANEETKAALNENSMFELASVSKQFTAMAIALLENKGKLSLTDEMSKYLPELNYYRGIKISNLIYHTSGLPDYMGLPDSIWMKWDEHTIATNKDVIAMFAQYHPALDFETGTKHEYSNTNYMLLASIVERVSGKPFGDYMAQNIFKPLGMDRTMIYNRRYAPKKVDNYAIGYVMDSMNRKVVPDSFVNTNYVYALDGIMGDGAVSSTVNDLLKWDQALYTDKLLPAAKRERLFESGKLNNGKPTNYGFGWFVKPATENERIVTHTGGWPGYVTLIQRDMAKQETIIMLQNTKMAKLPLSEVQLLMAGKPIPKAEELKEIQVTENILASYTGQYELDEGFILTISKEGQQLYGQATGQRKLPIYAASETKFFNKTVQATIEFVKEGEKVKEMIFKQAGQTINAPKID